MLPIDNYYCILCTAVEDDNLRKNILRSVYIILALLSEGTAYHADVPRKIVSFLDNDTDIDPDC